MLHGNYHGIAGGVPKTYSFRYTSVLALTLPKPSLNLLQPHLHPMPPQVQSASKGRRKTASAADLPSTMARSRPSK